MKPLLIAITGADGSGKSTACEAVRARLAARLGDESVLEVSIWDAMKTGQGTAPHPASLSSHSAPASVAPPFAGKAEAATYLGDLDGPSRTLFLFHAMSRSLQLAMRSEAAVLLLNGYWYKYAVSELGYGVEPAVVLGAARSFPTPDAVFCLDVDPATAWQRRQSASGYEQGAAASAIGASAEDGERFLRFQTRLRDVWKAVESQAKPEWIHIASTLPAQSVAEKIADRILTLKGGPS